MLQKNKNDINFDIKNPNKIRYKNNMQSPEKNEKKCLKQTNK